MVDYSKIDFSKISMNELGKKIAEGMAKELVDVQPMPSDALKQVYENSMSESDLIEEGYKPVSRHRLLWVKK